MKTGFTIATASFGVITALTLTACGSAVTETTGASPTSATESVAEPAASTRHFALEGAHNVRDIGGYSTADGKTVAWGRVFRADSLDSLTPDDQRAVADANVGTVVDFRGADEIAKSGVDQVPESIDVVNIPLLDESTQALSEAIQTAMTTGDPAVMQEMLGDGKAERIGDEGFVVQLDQPETMAGYADTMRLIADSDGALVYHCTAGKDRTGMMTALLLGLLGVPDDTIVDDFVLSNEFNREHNEETYAFLASKGVDIDLIRPLTEQSASKIQPVLDAVNNEYGGWDGFATTVLGLDGDTVTKLRDTLLT